MVLLSAFSLFDVAESCLFSHPKKAKLRSLSLAKLKSFARKYYTPFCFQLHAILLARCFFVPSSLPVPGAA
jgi:hypothetical protein